MSHIHWCVKDKVQPRQHWSLSPAGWSFLTFVLLLKGLCHLCPRLANKLPLPVHTFTAPVRGSKMTSRCLNSPTPLPASLSSQISEPPRLQQLFRFSSWAKTPKESNCSTLPPVKPHVVHTPIQTVDKEAFTLRIHPAGCRRSYWWSRAHLNLHTTKLLVLFH